MLINNNTECPDCHTNIDFLNEENLMMSCIFCGRTVSVNRSYPQLKEKRKIIISKDLDDFIKEIIC